MTELELRVKKSLSLSRAETRFYADRLGDDIEEALDELEGSSEFVQKYLAISSRHWLEKYGDTLSDQIKDRIKLGRYIEENKKSIPLIRYSGKPHDLELPPVIGFWDE